MCFTNITSYVGQLALLNVFKNKQKIRPFRQINGKGGDLF